MDRWITGGHEPVSPHTAEPENSGNRLQITPDPMACFTAIKAGRESVTVRLADSTSCGETGPANVLGELQEPKQDKESSLRDRGMVAGCGQHKPSVALSRPWRHRAVWPEVTSVRKQLSPGAIMRWTVKVQPLRSTDPAGLGTTLWGLV